MVRYLISECFYLDKANKMDNLEVTSMVLYIVLFISIVLSNLFVAVTMVSIKSLQTPSNLLLISLSIADLLTGAIAVLLRIFEVHETRWTLNISYCRLSHFFSVLNITVTILNLVALAIDRYIAVHHPYKYITLTSKSRMYIATAIITVWCFGTLIASLPYFAWGSNGDTGKRRVGGICKFNETLLTDYVLFFTIVVAISIAVIAFIDIKIYLIARQHRKRILPIMLDHENECQTIAKEACTSTTRVEGDISSGFSFTTSQSLRRKISSFQLMRRKRFLKTWRVTQTMFIIFSIFAICWIGFFVPTVLFIKCPKCANKYVVTVASLLLFSNNAINPFVYIIRMKTFRKKAKSAILKITCCKK